MPSHLITIPREPWTCTAQQKRVARRSGMVFSRPGRVLASTAKIAFAHTPEYQAAERELVLLLTSQRTKAKAKPITGACQVTLNLNFPYRAAEKAAIRKAGIPVPHAARPDLDNLSKLYIDALVKSGWIEDDGLIYHLTLAKWRTAPEEVGIRYRISTLVPE
jgi:Holliday junction resolvase RusA-like endonuclease